jgi:predicted Zn-dependent protease
MQHDQQEILYGTNPNASASKRVGYLNPIKICENSHTFRIEKDNEALQGLTDEEIEVRIQDLKKDFEATYATYIEHAMLQFQDRESIVAPYNFK